MRMIGKSDVGRIRSINEDRIFLWSGEDGLSLAIVADGMGGHQAGDVASQMAIDIIMSDLTGSGRLLCETQCEELLLSAIHKANAQIYDTAMRSEGYRGMGTTVVVALTIHDFLIIAHIGDSRAYKLSNDQMIQLTEDHSLVGELLRSGQLTEEEAANHPRRNVLTRALGTDFTAEVDIHKFKWTEGDYVLLCSDGLSNLVDDQTIGRIICSQNPLEFKVDALISKALSAGGDDNISVILLHKENHSSQDMIGKGEVM